ncbi:Serine/threonine-protein phosphatase 7 long form [Glycine max]|nr:Serine/threonine-protein phosphatase 7 long form [Glycine max]
MFQNIFGMGKKTENYTSYELSPCIKVKKKYQRKLFIYYGNPMEARNTYVSHEMRRVYYYSSRCFYFIRSPCGWVTINWSNKSLLGCEKLLGVRPQEGELQVSWVTIFSQLNNHDSNIQQLERFTHAWILRFIGGILFVDKSSSKVSIRYLECSTHARGPDVLAYLYREMCSATDYKTKSIGGMCILIQMWAWERCTTLAPKRTPPVIKNKPLRHKWLRLFVEVLHNKCYVSVTSNLFGWKCSVAWCTVVSLICFHVVEWHQPDKVLR